MGRDSSTNCKSKSHKLFKDKAKNRVDDLQGIFIDLQHARKEFRTVDVTVLEEQVHLMLREWKEELNEPSPASSLQQDGTLGSFSSDMYRLLQLCEEEDDANSALAPLSSELHEQVNKLDNNEGCNLSQDQHGMSFKLGVLEEDTSCGVVPASSTPNIEGTSESDFSQWNTDQNFGSNCEHYITTNFQDDPVHDMSGYLTSACPPPSAFLGPKCALWDCSRPAQGGVDWFQDYCSSFHHALALSEGLPGTAPVIRPGGIGLKDGLLFAALNAKVRGKDAGIPECCGAATSKSPWNAPELFDLSVLEGETVREWLFFDKPRRAFESGTRKQRSLPDYNGRGWHESRKQLMSDFDGLKRSYYMDPQPLHTVEWHLYEYEINKCDSCALYRLELKVNEGKRSAKCKTGESVADLQQQMGRLGARFSYENQRSVKGRTTVDVNLDKEGVYAAATPLVSANNG